MNRYILLIVLFCLMCVSVHATDQYISDGVVNLSFNVSPTFAGDDVTIMVLKPGSEWNQHTWKQEDSSIMAYYDGTKIKPDGSYEFIFYLENSGVYKAYLHYGDLTEASIIEIKFTNTEENKEAILALNNASSADQISSLLSTKREALGLYTEVFDKINKSDTAQILYSHLSTEDLNDSDSLSALSVLEKAVYIQALNQGLIQDINLYKETLVSPSLESWYNGKYATEMTETLAKKKYSTMVAFDSAIKEVVKLTAVKYADGYGVVMDVLKEDMTIGSETAKYIAGKSFGSLSELESAVKAYNTQKTPVVGGGTSGSSGGSFSNRSSLAGTDMTYDANTVTQANELTANNRFADLINVSWAKEAVEGLALRGILSGKTQNEFYPDDSILREEFIKIIVSTFGFNVVPSEFPFTDVSSQDWYYEFVRRAYGTGIVKGISQDVFGSGHNITRQDLAVIVYKSLKYCAIELEPNREKTEFIDNQTIADYAKEAVEALAMAGIINGYEDASFRPTGHTTRAEAAKIVYSLLPNIN